MCLHFLTGVCIYTQIDGVSMGNHLTLTLANLFMVTLETRLINTDSDNLVLYLRYVDDIFCIFRKTVSFNSFHEKLNELHKYFVFTYELGGKEIPFLDTKNRLSRLMETEIYLKVSDTEVMLNLNSVAL